jgi:LemA protein
MSPILIVGLVALALILYLISTYNWFVTSRTRIKASIQEIGNQLKRQSDLIPNLEASAKGYLKHEKDILKSLADARKTIAAAAKSTSTSKQANAASALADVLPRLSVVVESNPELKANTTINQLMEELRDTSDKVMYARRTLIDLTADFNVKVIAFPSNLVASMFSIKEQPGLNIEGMEGATTVKASETATPKISL